MFPDPNEPATQASLATFIGVSRVTVHNHHKAGLFTEGATLGVWVQEYAAKLRAEASGRAESGADGRTIMNNLNLAKTRKIELDIAKESGLLVAMEDVYEELTPFILHMKTTMNAAGNRIATALSAQHGIQVDKRLLDNEFRTALSAIADYEPKQPDTD